MALVNAEQVLYEFLSTSGNSLYTLCAKRVYFKTPPSGFDNTSAALVYHFSGQESTLSDLIKVIAVFKCYGGDHTDSAAETVSRALFDRLHNVSSQVETSGSIIHAMQITATVLPDDPDTGWKVSLREFEITMQA